MPKLWLRVVDWLGWVGVPTVGSANDTYWSKSRQTSLNLELLALNSQLLIYPQSHPGERVLTGKIFDRQ